MNYKSIFLSLILCTFIVACDDETSTLGVDMMPTSDLITSTYKTYDVSTQSYAVGDSVLARTSMSYLGRFTDPETETTIKSDFLAQFYCSENFAFPDSVVDNKILAANVSLFIENFVGDSLTNFKLSVYELDSILNPDADYYTNIDPEKYYNKNAEPIATKWYSLCDKTVLDSVRWITSGSNKYYNRINISLPQSVGQKIYDGYRQDPSKFKGPSAWIHSGLPCSKGLYFKLENGDGAMAYIDVSQFYLSFRYYDDEFKKDTAATVQFASTEEVVVATNFENSNLDKLMANDDVTYLKSPAGIFTLATLPVDEINVNDTINSATLKFVRYNDEVESDFKLSIPSTVLLVRLDDYLNGFFEKYKINDEETSFIANFSKNRNTYQFNNIASLISKMLQEKREGKATENWNKVLLIPVTPTYESKTSNTIVKLNHDFSMSSAKLVGGKNDKVKLDVIYSKFRY